MQTRPRSSSVYGLLATLLVVLSVGLARQAAAQASASCSPTSTPAQNAARIAELVGDAGDLGVSVTIYLDPRCTFEFASAGSADGGSALPPVKTAVVIEGFGAVLTRKSDAAQFRFAQVTAAGSLTLRNLRLGGFHAPSGLNGRNASAPSESAGTGGGASDGGAIHNAGTVLLEGTRIVFCGAGRGGDGGNGMYGFGAGFGAPGGHGGAIFNTGAQSSLTIKDSLLSFNSAGDGGHGGDTWANTQGGNGAAGGTGGAIRIESGTVRIEHSTLHGNSGGTGGRGGTGVTGQSVGAGGRGGDGGGVDSAGNLTILDSTVENNKAGQGGQSYYSEFMGGKGSAAAAGDGGNGGGLSVRAGSLLIQRSTFSYNRGGAANLGADTDSNLRYSTPGGGGGIFIAGITGTATIENSTIAANDASPTECVQRRAETTVVYDHLPGGNGGGLYAKGAGLDLHLKNVTFAGNRPGQVAGTVGFESCGGPEVSAGIGGSLFNDGARVHLWNTILSAPDWTPSPGQTEDTDNCRGTGSYTDETPSHNIAWNAGGSRGGCSTSFRLADPKLAAMPPVSLDFGRDPGLGPLTMALQPGSAALNAGDNVTCLTTDERGMARPKGGQCEIGAREMTLTVAQHPTGLTVTDPADASFSASADTDGFGEVVSIWQYSTNDGFIWTDIPDSEGGSPTTYTKKPTSASNHLTRYRAVFANAAVPLGVPTNAATLLVQFLNITLDLRTTIAVNAGSLFQLPYGYAANPAAGAVVWELRKGSGAAWQELVRFAGTTGGGSNLTDVATAEMDGWQYRFRLEPAAGIALPPVESSIATLSVSNIAGPPVWHSSYPMDSFAKEGDANDPAHFVGFVSANPQPTVGWQGVNESGVLVDLQNGSPTNLDDYKFSSTVGTNNSTFLTFRAWADQDMRQFRAYADNGGGRVYSKFARLYVQVPTEITLDCPSPVLHGATYQCTATVAAKPLRGPRARKPCGEVLVRTQMEQRTCYLNSLGQCSVGFTAPGQGWTEMQHQLIYFGGDQQPCEGGFAPPDQQSQGSQTVTVADCVKPAFPSCPAARTVDAPSDSCNAEAPDFLTGLALGETGCQVTLSQSPAAGTLLTPGAHDVTITAETAAGSASCTTRVTVRDATRPVVSVTGPDPLRTSCHQPVDLRSGVSASDSCDGTQTVQIKQANVDFNKPGTYTVTYFARDPWNNESDPVERTVIVADSVAPEVTLNGLATVYLECHGTYEELGAVAEDACDGVLTAAPSGSVDANHPGSYTVTYEARDSAGNIGKATRSVVVADHTPPTASLNGPAVVNLDCGGSWVDPGVSASDLCSGDDVRVWIEGTVNVNVPGPNHLIYHVTDTAGNEKLLERDVLVSGGGTPTIAIDGANPATVECHTGYTDAGATAKDACGRPVAVNASNGVDVNVPGSYQVTYTAGPATSYRTVNVVDTIKPTLALNDPTPITLECHRDSYVERGATATDSCAGTFAATPSGSVNVNAPGTYTITYNAKDPSGNAADAITRTVNVVDTTAPAFSCPGNQTVIAVPGSCAAVATYSASASDLCGGSTPVVFSPVSGSTFPVGATTVTATSTDAYSNKTTCSFTVTVLAAPTSVALSLSNATQQYSDAETLTATVTNSVTNAAVSGGSVTFKIGGSTVGTSSVGAGGVAALSLNLVESAVLAKADLAPGPHTVTAIYSGNAALCYAASPAASQTLTINQENARASYTGSSYSATSCATCGNAVVTLSATIWDITATPEAAGDTKPGDIRNATVTFLWIEGNKELATVPVGLVNAADLKVGAATYNWNVDIGQSDSEPYTIGVRVNGYYTRNVSTDYTVVTIAKPIGTNFISGGGHLVLKSSSGLKPGDVGSKTNFGFNVKYNKQGTNLQGKINAILRRLESDGVLHAYQIKGNAMTSLTVDAKAGTAVFNGKANITDITNPLLPVTVDGNGTLTVTMTDKGEPGSADTIGIALYNKAGGLWYSSNFAGGKTVEQLLGGGNLVVK